MIDQMALKAALEYDPLTGIFTWRRGKYNGKRAGCFKEFHQIRKIRVEGKYYSAGQLAFLWMTGRVPVRVFHRGAQDDDRWENLSTGKIIPKLNRQNKNGHIGVKQLKSGRYNSRIKMDGRIVYLGTYDSPKEAGEAYRKAQEKYHGLPAVPSPVG